MRKIFTFLLALVTSVGLMNAKVTWNSSNISDLNVYGTYESYSKEGVTLSANDDHNEAWWFGSGDESQRGILFYTDATGGFTFSNSLDKNFTKIEMFPTSPAGWDNANLGSDWSCSWEYHGDELVTVVTWKGNASKVVDLLNDVSSFNGENVKRIVFYFEGDSEEPDPTYTIALQDGTANADKVTLSKTSAVEGATITVTPNEEYEITDFWANYAVVVGQLGTIYTIDDATLDPATGAYSFTMPAADVTIDATIALKPVPNSITINGTSHGSVVASSSSAAAGETITLTATPDDGYQLKSISGVYEAQGPLSETLNSWGGETTITGTEFQCVGTMAANSYGWRVYNPGTANTLTVSSKDGETLIEKIELTSTWGKSRTNNMLSVSEGTLSFNGTPATTVTINNINATSVTISGSGDNAGKTWCISSVKIYYTGTIEKELKISDTENANVKTFTMVDSEVTISAEFEPAPEPQPQGQIISGGQDPQNKTYYYSTFFDSQVSYLLPEGVEAYVATISGDELTLTKIAVAGQTIPANNAVIFRANAKNFTLTPSTADAVTFSATNSLQGTDIEINAVPDCYVLSDKDGVIGFYEYNGNQLNAHKAYIIFYGSSSAPRRMRFIFAEEQNTTALDNAETDNMSVKVIENGQLVIIRNGVRYNAAGQVIE